MKNTVILLLLFSVFISSCKKEKEVQYTLFTASGDISTALNEFRTKLGPLNTEPGATTGRREVNWDGVPDSLLDTPLPFNFFNRTDSAASSSVQKGITYRDGDFQVSASGFDHLNPTASAEFEAFSGDQVFANTENESWPIGFEVAGKSDPASVQGFGMVFSDVDLPQSTSLEFFDGDRSLGKFYVPAAEPGSRFSFLGVCFHKHTITSVRVNHEGVIAKGEPDISQGGSKDLVVIDDIIYSEPVKR